MSSNLPDYLGTYRRSRFIRAGNACQIWEAMKGDGGRYILKVLRRENWGKSQEMAYLKHEYEVAHPLEHPSIIRIYDYCQEGKIAFLVLELFAELNLKQALRADHSRILANFSQIFEQSASSLQHLHDHKWVHCDVKPDNFLLNEDCHVKLIDFTIAKRISKNLLARLFGKKTQVRGTRSYMSPEQIRGKPLDARADIYSYGCVVYELLTNKLPYTGVNPDDLLIRHLRSAVPSVLVYNNSVTNEMNELVRRMMAKDPENRPASLQEALQEFRSLKPFKTAPRA
jgi:serine/threonine protein kinase